MTNQRTPEQIQREIEQARASLAETVDQIAQRTSPKAIADRGKQNMREKLQSTQGRAILAGVAVVTVLFVVWRLRRR